MSDPENVKRGKRNKRRGADFERECVKAAKDKHLRARRTALSGALEHEKGDVLIWPSFGPDAWDFECKRRAKLPVIFGNLGPHKGLIVRADKGEALAVIRYADLLDLLQ